jgi:CheY-like chemotaxis protein
VARILIIDDEPAVSLTLARMLEFEGHTVVQASQAADGLLLAAQDPPDAIVLDIRMPVMSGLEFLRALRRDERLQHLPVGIVTGDYFLDERVLIELASLGATIRYKPVWMEDLSALTRELLGSNDARSSGSNS